MKTIFILLSVVMPFFAKAQFEVGVNGGALNYHVSGFSLKGHELNYAYDSKVGSCFTISASYRVMKSIRVGVEATRGTMPIDNANGTVWMVSKPHFANPYLGYGAYADIGKSISQFYPYVGVNVGGSHLVSNFMVVPGAPNATSSGNGMYYGAHAGVNYKITNHFVVNANAAYCLSNTNLKTEHTSNEYSQSFGYLLSTVGVHYQF